jgi:exonuclease III
MKIKLSVLTILLVFIQGISFPQNRETIRIATYNILNYPQSYTTRNPNFQIVMNEIDADIVVVQEITSLFGVNEFRSSVLGNDYLAGPFINGPDTDNAIFYKDSLITLISYNIISTSLRDISEFLLYHNFSLDTFYIYSVHLKASQGSTNEQRRLEEVSELRNVTDLLPVGTQYMVVGDFNIYYSNEPAYQKLIEQVDPGYFIDMLPAGNWHNNNGFASIHTQSTCDLPNCPNGGSNGGLDDRFDMILISQSIYDSSGIFMIKDSNIAYGNDGLHFNKSINIPPYSVISEEIANALFNSSDHLPVYADFDFGTVSDVQEIELVELNFVLHQNYPNPFNPTTSIRFELPIATNVSVKVYDLLGREVKILVDGEMAAGNHQLELDASELPSGMYIYQLLTPGFRASKKLLLLK